MKFYITIIILFFCFQSSISQTKNEKEERIRLSDLPVKIQDIIKKLPEDYKRLKVYKEIDGKKHSFEVKLKYKNKHYSLEFSKDGCLEDIEVLTKFKNIEVLLQNEIKSYFLSTYNKYKLIKIQKQYIYNSNTGAAKYIQDILTQNSKLATNFEIIAEVRDDKLRNVREFTFNKKGEFLNFRILNHSTYEHVLY